jgi:O-antigen/teichoic acid export membrane protein
MIKPVDSIQRAADTLITRVRDVATRRSSKDLSALSVGTTIDTGLRLVTTLGLARLLGPESYGHLVLLLGWPRLIFGLLDAGSADVTVRYLSEYSKEGDLLKARSFCKLGYLVDFGVAIISFFVVAISAPLAEQQLINSTGSALLVIGYSLSLVFRSLLGTSEASLQVQERFKEITYINGGISVIRTTLILLLIIAGYGIPGAVAGYAAGTVARSLTFAWQANKRINKLWGGRWWSTSVDSVLENWREILNFFAFNNLTIFLDILVKKGDVIILGYLGGPEGVGFYKIALTFGAVTEPVLGPLRNVVYPKIAERAVDQNRRTALEWSLNTFLYRGLPVGGAIGLVAVAAPWFVPLFFGQKYVPAIPAAQLMVIAAGVSVAFFWLRPLFYGYNDVQLWSAVSGANTVATVGGWALIIPVYGFIGMSFWYMLMTILSHGGGWLMFHRRL